MRDGLALSPSNAWLNSNLGLCLFRTKKFREAVPYLQRAVELDPQNPYYHIRLSDALLRTKDRKGSDDHLRTALALKPDDAFIQTNLGWRLRGRGRRIEANETFREALRLNPRNRAAKVGLGIPLARRAGLIDALFRFSFMIFWMPHRRILIVLQWLTLFAFLLLASPYVDPSQGQIVAAFFLIWVTYYSLAGQVVKIIGKRRGVHFK